MEIETDQIEDSDLPLDTGFSGQFTVSKNDWFIRDRIEEFGFIYIHIITLRPLAIYRTIDIDGNVNGHSIISFTNAGIVDHSLPLAKTGEIDALLVEISLDYVVYGIWSKCIIDEDQENMDNNEKFHDIISVDNQNDPDEYDEQSYNAYYAYFLQCLNMHEKK